MRRGSWGLRRTGFDYSTMTPAEGIVEQTRQALRNIEEALHEAGSSLSDVVRVTYVLPDPSLFPQTWPVILSPCAVPTRR